MPTPQRTEDVSDVIVNTRVTAEERERIRRAAAVNLQKPSEFIRDVVLDAVSEALDGDDNTGEP